VKPLLREFVTDRLETLAKLDPIAKPLQALVNRYVPDGSTQKDALSGTWLGHPLHPLLTDVVIGCWTSAAILDLTPGKTGKASDRLIALGILAAVPTAAAGLSDFADLGAGSRRVATVHAGGNVTALLLQSMSWLARKRGHRVRGWMYSMTAMGLATASAYLGGHLSFGKGVGVSQAAFQDLPRNWTRVMMEDELPEGALTGGMAKGTEVLLYRTGTTVYALVDRCSHRGCGLHGGEVEGGDVVCPCHGSRFRLADGSVQHGPATAPQPRLEVRIREGIVEVRRPREESVRPVAAAS
jgi:nitrite reductase/ring-hydroxylating ferredoxin subunit/uncharacterized membrane protein